MTHVSLSFTINWIWLAPMWFALALGSVGHILLNDKE